MLLHQWLDHLTYSLESLLYLIMLLIRFKVMKLILSIVRHSQSLVCSLSLPVTLDPVFCHKDLGTYVAIVLARLVYQVCLLAPFSLRDCCLSYEEKGFRLCVQVAVILEVDYLL